METQTQSEGLKLPTAPTLDGASMEEMIWILYGPPGIGKSTFVAQCPGALFLSTDPGLRFLSVMKQPVSNWLNFKKIVKALEVERPKVYKALVIDTIDPLFMMARKYVCDKRGIEHPSDEQWGKGYDLVTSEFVLEILKLTKLPYGLFFLDHAKEQESQGRVVKTSKTVPAMHGQAYKALAPLADIIAYYGFGTESADSGDLERKMFFQQSATMDAKDRTKGGLPESLVIPEEGGFKLVEAHLMGHVAKEPAPQKRIFIKRK